MSIHTTFVLHSHLCAAGLAHDPRHNLQDNKSCARLLRKGLVVYDTTRVVWKPLSPTFALVNAPSTSRGVNEVFTPLKVRSQVQS